ncbi:PLP-dependent transferase [Gonapodya prolifera JEL478]|uniref:glutamate decarboxylase n=1 Tax=Gonapodya prolifera (strain JEL478) TaxID=1344416 RepID=A0A139A7N7_GONPJ|nr:PLP-dependent transferase [Gonapodya prolifera JEL478]|eukprot:KXS12821.1 PLP-dependent transferase [Gonapodya prolifera JEL478]
MDKESHATNIGVVARFGDVQVPKVYMREEGVDPAVAYRLVHDELCLDGNPTQNLASFVTTHVEDEATKLFTEACNKNLADGDEYPQTMELETRCLRMLADLRNCQSALEKFATYFDVETRYVDVSLGSHLCNDPHEAIKLVDENTIGVIMIMGSTYTGHFEDVKTMVVNELLDEFHKEKGIDVSIHVDGASGGFVAPFLFPDLVWDFRLSRSVRIFAAYYTVVKLFTLLASTGSSASIRAATIGGNVSSFTLNFSRNAANVILQYYQFVRLGRSGYRAIMAGGFEVARVLSVALERSGAFHVFSQIHQDLPGLPVVAFGFSEDLKRENPSITEYKLEHELRRYGWIVPAYPLPRPLQGTKIMRVVVRESSSFDLMDLLFRNLMQVTEMLVEEARVHAAATVEKKKAMKNWGKVVNQIVEQSREQKHFPRQSNSKFKWILFAMAVVVLLAVSATLLGNRSPGDLLEWNSSLDNERRVARVPQMNEAPARDSGDNQEASNENVLEQGSFAVPLVDGPQMTGGKVNPSLRKSGPLHFWIDLGLNTGSSIAWIDTHGSSYGAASPSDWIKIGFECNPYHRDNLATKARTEHWTFYDACVSDEDGVVFMYLDNEAAG